MAITSNTELVDYFKDPANAAAFGTAFVQRFVSPAFGVLPKTEVEFLVFELMVVCGALDPNGSIFTIARTLNITPAKAKSMIFQYQLRNVSEADTAKAVLVTLVKASYFKEGDKLAFGVESPLVRAAIAAKMREKGVFADVSLSGDILKVSPKQFGEIVGELLPKAAANILEKALKKKDLKEHELRKALKDLGEDTVKDFLKEEGKQGLIHLMEGLGDLLKEHGPEAGHWIVEGLGHLL